MRDFDATAPELDREPTEGENPPRVRQARPQLRCYMTTVLDEEMDARRSLTQSPGEYLVEQAEIGGPPAGERDTADGYGDQGVWQGKRFVGVVLLSAKGWPLPLRLRDDDGTLRRDVNELIYRQMDEADDVRRAGRPVQEVGVHPDDQNAHPLLRASLNVVDAYDNTPGVILDVVVLGLNDDWETHPEARESEWTLLERDRYRVAVRVRRTD